MKIELVVARYNEDLSWLKKINKNIKITIYNKGDPINFKNIKLPNVGRESHTYLTHILNNYDNLADITIFTQADPFLHSPHFLTLLNYIDLFQPIQPLSSFYSPSYDNASNYFKEYIVKHHLNLVGIPPKNVCNKTKNLSIKDINIFVEYLDKNFVPKYPVSYYPESVNFFKYFKKIFGFDNILHFVKTYYKIKNIQLSKLLPVSYCGLFSVRKELILENKPIFYKNIMNSLLSDYEKYKIDCGYLIERLWLSIFNYQKYNKFYKSLNQKDFLPKYNSIKLSNANHIGFTVKTRNPIFLIIIIDKTEYNVDIYNKQIKFRKRDYIIEQIKKINIDFNKKIDVQISVALNNYFEVKVNSKKFVYTEIPERKIENIQIEKNFYSLDIKKK